MNTTDIMNIALELAGFKDVPGDSDIFHHGENIKKVLFGIDIWDADLNKAKELGVDLVISHHPPNLTPGKRFVEVIDRQIEFMVSAGVPFEGAQKAIKEEVGVASLSLTSGSYHNAIIKSKDMTPGPRCNSLRSSAGSKTEPLFVPYRCPHLVKGG